MKETIMLPIGCLYLHHLNQKPADMKILVYKNEVLIKTVTIKNLPVGNDRLLFLQRQHMIDEKICEVRRALWEAGSLKGIRMQLAAESKMNSVAMV